MLPAQECQTNLPGRKVHIGMADGGDECDFGWCEGVCGGHGDGEEPQPAVVRGGRVSRSLQHGFPLEEIFVVRRAEVEDRIVGGRLQVLKLVSEAFESVRGGGFARAWGGGHV